MKIFYDEIRNKVKNSNKSNKNNNTEKTKKNKLYNINNNKKEQEPLSIPKIPNIKKSKSFFFSQKLQELKSAPKFLPDKNENRIEYNKKNNNKKFSYTFQNFFNNYPLPEPLPKKIDIKIINNQSNFSSSNINETSNRYKERDNKNIYDDKKILFILINLGLENLFSKFKDNLITYNDLKFLEKNDFIEMKIPIGPRNRIIHFIQELKKNGTDLDFEELRNFIVNYKKLISGHKPKTRNVNNNNYIENKIINESNLNDKYFENKNSQNNSFLLSSQFESENYENISKTCMNKNDIKYNNSVFTNNKPNINILEEYKSFNYSNKVNNNKKKNYFLSDIEEKFENEKAKDTKIKSNKNDDDLNYLLNNQKDECNYNKRNNNIKNFKKNNTVNNINKTNFPYNFKNKKISHTNPNNSSMIKYKEYIPKPTNRKKIHNKVKCNSVSVKKMIPNKNININNSLYSNNSCLSKNLLSKLEIINKEVEKYQNNYERLKIETKRRNKNVIRILANNSFGYKKNNNFITNFTEKLK